MSSMFSLAGEQALITGGGTGLGLGIARCFVQAGAQVVLVGRREEPLRQAIAELGPAARYAVHDVTRRAQAGALLEQIGPVSILVHNAGTHLKKPALETTSDEFDLLYQTHVLAAHALTRAAAPAMMARGHGSILFIASMAALFGIPQVAAYSAAKSALLGLTRTLATELSPRGVRVNAIAPGWIDSEMSRKALAGDPGRRDKILGRTPLGRLGETADIGWAAVYLCSPQAGFVTGAVLPVDGGVSIGF